VTERGLDECRVRARLYAEGAVLCRAADFKDADIIHRKDAGCRRANPVLMELTADDVEALLRIEVMRDNVTLPPRTLFCQCAVQCGPAPSRHDVLQARLRRAERALELAEERNMDAVARFEWEEAEAQAKGFYGQTFRDAQARASDTMRAVDYARHRLDAVTYVLSAPTLEMDV
jgi:hypothetical protein